MSEYRTLFDVRGGRYNRANRLFPQARVEEADRLLAHWDRAPAGRWLDVGAGGGFLAQRAAARGIDVPAIGCDESPAFLGGAVGYGLKAVAEHVRLPFADDVFDAVGCLAVLHHAEDPRAVLAEMLRVTAARGRVAVGDVAADSRAARFLNGFVGVHNETGHDGRFYAARELAALLAGAGGRDVRADETEIVWRFPCRADARLFFRELFGLRPATPEDAIDEALGGLGYFDDAGGGGGGGLPWAMVFASASR